MNHNSRGVAHILIILLVLVAIGAVGFLAIQNNKSSTPDSYLTPTSTTGPGAGQITISDSYEHIDTYQLNSMTIEDDKLAIGVSYSGGCKDHNFNLTWIDGNFFETSPPQADLFLVHDANNDNCEAYLTQQHKFDLTPLITSALQQYQTKEFTINIYDFNNLKQQVTYSPSGFVDQDSGFVCPQQKTIDCTPCTGSMCPLSDPQYCHKGTPQYNWIMDNCPDVEIINAS